MDDISREGAGAPEPRPRREPDQHLDPEQDGVDPGQDLPQPEDSQVSPEASSAESPTQLSDRMVELTQGLELGAREFARALPPADGEDLSDAEIARLAQEMGEAGEGESDLPPLHDAEELDKICLALLLTNREAVSVLRLAQVCNAKQDDVRAGLDRLAQSLRTAGLPLELVLAGDQARLLTLPEVFPYLQRMRGIKKAERLSAAALETLAVIAYKQPAMRAEIEAIRGVKAGPMLRTLLEHKLITITGRADVPGRPLQYGTTAHFLDRFGLTSLKDLPSLKELKALG